MRAALFYAPAGLMQQQVANVLQSNQLDYFGMANVKLMGAKGDGVTDDTAIIQNAIDTYGFVFLPPGNYSVTSLKFNSNNCGIVGSGYNKSILTMSAVANVAIEVGNVSSVSGFVMRNIKLLGNATNIGAIKLGTAANHAGIVTLDDLFIDGFTNANVGNGYGIQLNSVQEIDIHNVWVQNNRINVHRPNLGYCTSTRISGKKSYIGISSYRGVLIEGQCDDLYIEDAIVEGNSKAAIEVTNTAVSGPRGTRVWLKKLYFESNLNSGVGAGQYVINIVGGAAQYQEHKLSMDSCEFANDPNAPGGYKRLKVDRVIGRVVDSIIAPQDIETTALCFMRFDGNRYSSASDYLSGYRALLGSVIVNDFTPAFDNTFPDQVNLFNAIQFPVVPRPVADRYTLDSYIESLNGDEFVPVLTGFGGAATAVTLRTIKIGRDVKFSLVINANALSSGGYAATAISLPYQPVSPSIGKAFNATATQSIGDVYIDTSGSILMPPFAAITGVIVVSGQYLTTS